MLWPSHLAINLSIFKVTQVFKPAVTPASKKTFAVVTIISVICFICDWSEPLGFSVYISTVQRLSRLFSGIRCSSIYPFILKSSLLKKTHRDMNLPSATGTRGRPGWSTPPRTSSFQVALGVGHGRWSHPQTSEDPHTAPDGETERECVNAEGGQGSTE